MRACPSFVGAELIGELQGANGFLSTRHSKVEPASLEMNSTLAFLAFFFDSFLFGGFVIVVGGVVSGIRGGWLGRG